MSLGKCLDSVTIQSGLRELNPDMVFDVAHKLSDWSYMLQMPAAMREAIDKLRLPVLHRDRYICAMDRGMVPELKQHEETERVAEVPARPDDDGAFYCRTSPGDRSYQEQYDQATTGDKSYSIQADGSVTRWYHFRKQKALGKVLLLGWRHTFEALIAAKIPGITRQSLAEKFGVDLYTVPVGTVSDLAIALTAE